jgi:hypothetical protein
MKLPATKKLTTINRKGIKTIYLKDPTRQTYLNVPVPILHKEFKDGSYLGAEQALNQVLELERQIIRELDLKELIIVEDLTCYMSEGVGQWYERIAIPPEKQKLFCELHHFR